MGNYFLRKFRFLCLTTGPTTAHTPLTGDPPTGITLITPGIIPHTILTTVDTTPITDPMLPLPKLLLPPLWLMTGPTLPRERSPPQLPERAPSAQLTTPATQPPPMIVPITPDTTLDPITTTILTMIGTTTQLIAPTTSEQINCRVAGEGVSLM